MDFHKTVGVIEKILKDNTVWYERFEHEAVRTSEEAAAVRRNYDISQGTKALIIRTKKNGEKQFAMIVVSGDKKFDTKKAKEVLKAKDIRFATEDEVLEITDGVKPGGVPPFGNLFNLPVYADDSVFTHEKIIFNAGDKQISIGMHSKDYKEIVAPIIVSIT